MSVLKIVVLLRLVSEMFASVAMSSQSVEFEHLFCFYFFLQDIDVRFFEVNLFLYTYTLRKYLFMSLIVTFKCIAKTV
jgi:hypothetical protein